MSNNFEANRNPELAIPMSAYIRYQFDFLGIETPLRNELFKKHLSAYQLPYREKLIDAVWKLYELPEHF